MKQKKPDKKKEHKKDNKSQRFNARKLFAHKPPQMPPIDKMLYKEKT